MDGRMVTGIYYKRLKGASAMKTTTSKTSGFTLVELAIVLVIIGLIIGGVLVGQDLIKAATVRAAVSQLEKYDTAANAFRNKYNGLPGDLPIPTNFFSSVTNMAGGDGEGDGDGLVEGTSAATTVCTTTVCLAGEAELFWYELNQAGLISDAITGLDGKTYNPTVSSLVLPASKLGKGASVAVASFNGRNYYSLANFTVTIAAGTGTFKNGVSVIDAYNIDTKMDDGVPTSGKVMSIATTTALPTVAANGAAGGSSTTCYNSTPSPAVYNTASTLNAADSINCNLGIRTSF
jgi:prepilin-type N-terminal cleavage/methylation domain-containing protein